MSGAYDQYVSQVYCLLEKYGNKKNMKKFEQKIKCIVQEAFHLSRRNSEQPFLPASPAEWMSLFYNDTCVTKKFIRNCDRVFFPCKITSKKNLGSLNFFNFYSQLPGLTDKCFESLIIFLTSLSSENNSDISGALSLACGGNDKISFNGSNVIDETEVVLIKSPDSSFLFPFNYYNGDYFVLQSVLNPDFSQEAIDYTKYANDKIGVGIYGKVSPKNKSGYINFKLEAIYISENSTGPKPLSISSLAIKYRRTLLCKLLNGGGTGSGGKGGGNGGKGGEGGGIGGKGGGATGSGSGDGESDDTIEFSEEFKENIKGIDNEYFYINKEGNLHFYNDYTGHFTDTSRTYKQFKNIFFIKKGNRLYYIKFEENKNIMEVANIRNMINKNRENERIDSNFRPKLKFINLQ